MKRHWIRPPTGLPEAEIFRRARAALLEGHTEGGKLGLTPPGPHAGDDAPA